MLKTRLHARFAVNCQQKIKQDGIAAKDAYFVKVVPLVRLNDLHSKGSSPDEGSKIRKYGFQYLSPLTIERKFLLPYWSNNSFDYWFNPNWH